MYSMNITVQHQDKALCLTRGKPEQVGIQKVSNHMVFSCGDLEITVWVVGMLTMTERQQIIDSTWSYLESITS